MNSPRHPLRLGLGLGCALVLLAPVDRAAAAPRCSPDASAFAAQESEPKPPQHVHQWSRQSRKEWVPPVTKQVQVGVDSHGKPIVQTQIVKPGYWRTVTYLVCACGAVRS